MDSSLDLRVQLAPRHPTGLILANPVMIASGIFGYGEEYSQLIEIQELGAVVCKGTTFLPRRGNPQPRLVETASGLLNSIGLENIGIEDLVQKEAPMWAEWRVPMIVNVAGETVDEYARVAARLEGVPGIRGIEVNISCPNVAAGGVEFGVDPVLAARVTAAVKGASSLPVMVKLSPNVTDIEEIAMAVEEAGADAISLINTLKGMAVDINTGKPRLGNITGGLSGPAIKPIALHMVYQVAEVTHIPVVGCGGIASASDALEFLMCGASAIQVGTANFSEPGIGLAIVKGIEEFMQERKMRKLADIVGLAH